MKKPTREKGNSPVQAEALPLPVSLLQVLRMVHFLRKCTMRKTCKKSFRSPKATMLRDRVRNTHIVTRAESGHRSSL